MARLDFSGFVSLVSAIILLDVVLTPILIVGLMVLLERGEGSFAALAVTPLSRSAYLAARTLTVSMISSAEMLLLVMIAYDGEVSGILLAGALVSLSAIVALSAIIIVAPFNSLYAFILPMFGWVFFLGMPAYGVLIGWDAAWLAWHPTSSAMVLLEGAFEPLEISRLGFGIAGVVLWIAVMSFLALQALRFMQARAAGG